MKILILTGGWIVIQTIGRYVMILAACFLILGTAVGCKEEKADKANSTTTPGPAGSSEPSDVLSGLKSGAGGKMAGDTAVAVEVDGVKLTKAELNMEIENQLASYKGQLSAEQKGQAKADIRKRLIDEYVKFILLNKEIAARKVTASDGEIEKGVSAARERIKSQLPAGVKIEDLIKNRQIDMEKMRAGIALEIKMDKLIEKEMGGKVKITDKEIADFYEKNKAEFVKPETAHARHILVSKTQGDTDKILKEKKAKAEADCPSKTSGGDLGTLGRDQTVKPFNDAIFSQPMKAIGPIVETQFGFHIIQVLDRRAAQTVKLDSAGVKSQIKDHLEALKKQGAVNAIVKRLRASANIEVYGS
jgi:peptidyl-prolyl cis-trans isomerase C